MYYRNRDNISGNHFYHVWDEYVLHICKNNLINRLSIEQFTAIRTHTFVKINESEFHNALIEVLEGLDLLTFKDLG